MDEKIELETVAKFKDENYTFTIMQPIKEDPEKRKAYYNALAKATFKQRFKP
jgi:hypothetical protein